MVVGDGGVKKACCVSFACLSLKHNKTGNLAEMLRGGKGADNSTAD